MYWVWNHSRSKGTGRHVMLACANWITGPDCTVRASTAELVRFANAARSSVIKAVDDLVKSGELQILEEARGTRAALYRIPGAVSYVRPERGSRGPKIGPLADSERSGNETSSPAQGSGNETPDQNARGPKTGPQGSENRTPRGPKTGPHKQHHWDHAEEEASTAPPVREFSDEEMKEYGSFWLLHPKSKNPDNTLDLWKAAVASGVDPKKITAAAVAYAKEKAGEPFRFIKQSDNWIRERRYEDKFEAAPDANGRPPLRAVSGGYQPYSEPTPEERAADLGHF